MHVENTEFLFVYGSLKRGYALHFHMQSAQFVSNASTVAEYRLFDCGEYPALVADVKTGYCVEGELFHVSQQLLVILDDVEGVKESLYARQPVQLQPPHNEIIVWGYHFLRPVKSLRECGKSWPCRERF